MQPLLKGILASGLLLLTAGAASAQTPSPACPSTGKPGIRQVASDTGCPFSAIMEIENAQALANGTNIQRKSKALIYRDSRGRIRYEDYAPTYANKDAAESPSMILIYDPVAGSTYLLTPQNAVAIRSRLNHAALSPKANAQPQHVWTGDSASTQTQWSRPTRIAEKLGTQLMEGLLVTGRRDTVTIPAGAEGIDRPLVIVSEVWDSSDMGIRLLVKLSDPRTGETVHRVTDLKLTEPDASLFQVPADYTIKGE